MSEQQRKNSLLRSSISINSIRRSALQFTKSLDRSNIIAKDIIKTTKDKNLFDRKTISKDNEYFRKRRENVRRKQREDELEASSITGVTKREGTVAAKSTKGFLGRILDFFGIILIGWFVTKLPGIIKAIGNVINVIKKAVGFLTGFVDGVRDFLTGIGDGIKTTIDAFPKFDFMRTRTEGEKTIKETESTLFKLNQDFIFASRVATNSFDDVLKDNPDLDQDGVLVYDEEQEKQLRGDVQPSQEGTQEDTETTDDTMIASADGFSVGTSSDVEGTNTAVTEQEITLGDDDENKKIEEAIDKLELGGKRLENTGEDEESKQLASKVAESTAGVGAGGASNDGAQTGGTGGITGAKTNINEKNVKLSDNKEDEVDEEESEEEKGVPIKNKRGRIIGYKKVDPAQVSKKDDSIISSTSQNVEMSDFDIKKREILLREKYGGTGRPITVATPDGDVTYNPGDKGYLEAFNIIQNVSYRDGAIVPLSRKNNNLEMTNKTDRPTIIFTDAGAPVSSSPSMGGGGGGRSGEIILKNSNDSQTMKKIHTLILES